MRILRWILLGLYLALIVGLGGRALEESEWALGVMFAVQVIGLTVFILGAGTRNLCRPIRRPRLLAPVIAAALMMAGLVAGLALALGELFIVEKLNGSAIGFWTCLVLSWIAWAVLLFVYTKRLTRYWAIYRLGQFVFAGSLAELLAAVPSHIFVTRRGGCFAGLHTMAGVIAGMFVMFWSFGPGILLLFLKEARQRAETPRAKPVSVDVPSPRPFQFRLQTLVLMTIGLSVAVALSKTFWGSWLAAMITAFVAMLLFTPVFALHPKLLIAAALGGVVGMFWVSWGAWTATALVALPLSVMLILLLRVFLSQVPIEAVTEESTAQTGCRRRSPWDEAEKGDP